jgi:hypothetical protein
MTRDIVQVKDIPKKDLWCWHCLKWIRWLPNPHQIHDVQEILQRPYGERHVFMPLYGINPDEASMDPQINRRDLREFGAQQLNPYSQHLSLMNLLEETILWKEEEGGAVPFCPYCESSLLNQNVWASIREWIKYSLILLALILSLWLLTLLLG